VQQMFECKCSKGYPSVYSLSYPACNAHASYCHLWHIFTHYLTNGKIFGVGAGGGVLLNTKCVLIFSAPFV